jgi:hypothetical protein
MQPDRAAARRALGLRRRAGGGHPAGQPRSEIEYLARRFFRRRRCSGARGQRLQFVCRRCRPAAGDRGSAACSRPGRQVQIVAGQSHTALAACDVTLIASGTATLEAALFKRPMVIAYNMHWLSWQIMRRKRLQPWVGLPNILCRDFVVPELLQEQATPQALARGAGSGWTRLRGSRLQQRFTALHQRTAARHRPLATDAIEKVLESLNRRAAWDTPGLVAGVDEAGRGPLAGPVVAAAVILDDAIRSGLADSKKLSALRRERLFDEIRAKALVLLVGRPVGGGDRPLNILQATMLAMRRAVKGCG